MADTQVAWLINQGCNYLLSGEAPKRRGNEHPNIVPYQVFEVADGHVVVAVGNDAQFTRFCRLIGMPGLADDERYANNVDRLSNRDALIETLAVRLSAMQRDELIAAMDAHDVPGGPINSLPEVFASDQVEARGMKISMPNPQSENGSVELIGNPINFSKTQVTYRRAPPVCGADTRDVISEVLGQEKLDAAIAAGTID